MQITSLGQQHHGLGGTHGRSDQHDGTTMPVCISPRGNALFWPVRLGTDSSCPERALA